MSVPSLFSSLLNITFISLVVNIFSHLPLSNAQNVGDDAPLWVQGALEGATVADNTFNSGGTITVNSFIMNVPKNLLVQFPAAWVPWRDFVGNMTDFMGFETLVTPTPLFHPKYPMTTTCIKD